MRLSRKRRYYFTDSSVASDTVIAFVMGGLSLVIELAGIVDSIISKGNVPEIFGVLYLCAVILSAVGLFFAYLGNKAQEGGVKGKRISIILNIIALITPILIIII